MGRYSFTAEDNAFHDRMRELDKQMAKERELERRRVAPIEHLEDKNDRLLDRSISFQEENKALRAEIEQYQQNLAALQAENARLNSAVEAAGDLVE